MSAPFVTRPSMPSRGRLPLTCAVLALLVAVTSMAGCATDKKSNADVARERAGLAPAEPNSNEAATTKEASPDESAGKGADAEADEPPRDPYEPFWLVRRDVQAMVTELSDRLRNSPLGDRWQGAVDRGEMPTMHITVIRDKTRSELQTPTSAIQAELEKRFYRDERVEIVATGYNDDKLAELEEKYGPKADLKVLVEFGRHLNVDYLLTGKITTAEATTSNSEQVEYRLALAAVDVARESLVVQARTRMTKRRPPGESDK